MRPLQIIFLKKYGPGTVLVVWFPVYFITQIWWQADLRCGWLVCLWGSGAIYRILGAIYKMLGAMLKILGTFIKFLKILVKIFGAIYNNSLEFLGLFIKLLDMISKY